MKIKKIRNKAKDNRAAKSANKNFNKIESYFPGKGKGRKETGKISYVIYNFLVKYEWLRHCDHINSVPLLDPPDITNVQITDKIALLDVVVLLTTEDEPNCNPLQRRTTNLRSKYFLVCYPAYFESKQSFLK